MTKGWYGNKMGHSLASRGIKSSKDLNLRKIYHIGVMHPDESVMVKTNYSLFSSPVTRFGIITIGNKYIVSDNQENIIWGINGNPTLYDNLFDAKDDIIETLRAFNQI